MNFDQVRIVRKLTYSIQSRRFAHNPNLIEMRGFGPKLEFCNYLNGMNWPAEGGGPDAVKNRLFKLFAYKAATIFCENALAQFTLSFYIYKETQELVFGCADIRTFEAASIAQLIQVELLQRRFTASNLRRRHCQIPNS
ncbi:MAG TPA: hypothetical protein VFU89_07265 [Rhabdochlamydiaceae bacterium]|nr:hypothetical protein [Rhabdochlamydiaceae bacterium]